MSLTAIGIIGIIILVILLFTDMPVGFVMGLVGFVGFSIIKGIEPGLKIVAKDVFEVFSSYSLTVLPLFIFMGQIAFFSGISSRLFEAAYVMVGNRKGGLAVATVGACAGFAAISGSTSASAATMTLVSLPEMRKYKYDLGLATGTIAAAGSLGILIPPSTTFILYGILTEQSIGKLFAAGILPGILLSLLFVLVIYLRVSINPSLAPPGEKNSFKKKIKAFIGVFEAMLIFLMVMGGIFLGVFSPTEAAAMGAFFTLALAVVRKQLSWKNFLQAVGSTTSVSCMIMVIVVGATIFGHFMAVTRVPFEISIWVSNLPWPNWAIMIVITLIYLLGGCFMDAFALIMLTIPIFFPVSQALGYDPIWFGVVIILVTEMGVITPPVGINVYVVNGVAPDIPLDVIFRGVLPMVLALLVCNLAILIFPQIATFLPSLMR